MSAGPGVIEDLAEDLVASPVARHALLTDPGRWCADHQLDRTDVEGLTGCVRRRAAGLDPAERRVALAACFALELLH